MARIRTVKPSFFRHEGLQELELQHPGTYPMFVFAGLWGHCDKGGRFEWKPRTLKLDILPFLPFDMAEALGILERHGYLQRYEVEGKVYGFIPTFTEHQRINGKEAHAGDEFPGPPVPGIDGEAPEKQRGSDGEAPEKQRGSDGEATGKQPRSSGEAVETTGREGNRKGTGREQEGDGRRAPPRDVGLEEFGLTPDLEAWAVKEGIQNPGRYVEEFKDYWRSVGGRRRNGQAVKDWPAAFRNRMRQLKAMGKLLAVSDTLEERLRKWADEAEVAV